MVIVDGLASGRLPAMERQDYIGAARPSGKKKKSTEGDRVDLTHPPLKHGHADPNLALAAVSGGWRSSAVRKRQPVARIIQAQARSRLWLAVCDGNRDASI